MFFIIRGITQAGYQGPVWVEVSADTGYMLPSWEPTYPTWGKQNIFKHDGGTGYVRNSF